MEEQQNLLTYEITKEVIALKRKSKEWGK